MAIFKLKVKEIIKDEVLKDETKFLDVECLIVRGEKVVETRKLSFPLDIDTKKMKQELKKYINNYNMEYIQNQKRKKADIIQSKANKTIEKMKGVVIK